MLHHINELFAMNGQISRKVYEKISQEDIKMRPRYYFNIVFSFWKVLAILLLAAAALSLSALLYDFQMGEGEMSVVYLSVALFFIYGASRCYRQSRLCCRFSDIKLMLMMLLVVFFAGWALHNVNLSGPLHNFLEKNIEHRSNILLP